MNLRIVTGPSGRTREIDLTGPRLLLASVLVVFTLIGTLAMPWLVWAMASGFAGDARFDLAVLFGRISFSYILFISLVALLSGILNAFGKFTEASIVPVLMNLMFMAAMLLADRMGWDIGLTLAWTVPITGVTQLAAAGPIVVPAASGSGRGAGTDVPDGGLSPPHTLLRLHCSLLL